MGGGTAADYGLDAPGAVRWMLIIGGACLAAAVAVALGLSRDQRDVATTLAWYGFSFAFFGSLMVLSSRVGKLRARDQLLDRLAIDPSATVLDVGCGHGLLLIGAARRLATGRAIGVDVWSQKDQGDNSAAATLANADAESVRDRVEVRDGDVRALPFADATFDVIVSSLVLHNLGRRADRSQAIKEIVRVLKPGGQIGIMDIRHVGQYANDLRAAGMTHVSTHGITPWIFPPTRVLIARK